MSIKKNYDLQVSINSGSFKFKSSIQKNDAHPPPLSLPPSLKSSSDSSGGEENSPSQRPPTVGASLIFGLSIDGQVTATSLPCSFSPLTPSSHSPSPLGGDLLVASNLNILLEGKVTDKSKIQLVVNYGLDDGEKKNGEAFPLPGGDKDGEEISLLELLTTSRDKEKGGGGGGKLQDSLRVDFAAPAGKGKKMVGGSAISQGNGEHRLLKDKKEKSTAALSPLRSPLTPHSPGLSSHLCVFDLPQVWKDKEKEKEKDGSSSRANCVLVLKKKRKELSFGEVFITLGAFPRMNVTVPIQAGPKLAKIEHLDLLSVKLSGTKESSHASGSRSLTSRTAKKQFYPLKFLKTPRGHSSKTSRKLSRPAFAREVMFQCFQFLSYSESLATEGIFRVSAPHPEINMLREMCEGGHEISWDCGDSYGSHHGAHTVGGVLMAILLEMEEPLISFEFYGDLLGAERNISDMPTKLQSFKNLLHKLDTDHKTVLERLMRLLSLIAENPSNKMTSNNLAIVFGPAILRSKVETPAQVVADSPLVIKIVCHLVENAEFFFPSLSPILIPSSPPLSPTPGLSSLPPASPPSVSLPSASPPSASPPSASLPSASLPSASPSSAFPPPTRVPPPLDSSSPIYSSPIPPPLDPSVLSSLPEGSPVSPKGRRRGREEREEGEEREEKREIKLNVTLLELPKGKKLPKGKVSISPRGHSRMQSLPSAYPEGEEERKREEEKKREEERKKREEKREEELLKLQKLLRVAGSKLLGSLSLISMELKTEKARKVKEEGKLRSSLDPFPPEKGMTKTQLGNTRTLLDVLQKALTSDVESFSLSDFGVVDDQVIQEMDLNLDLEIMMADVEELKEMIRGSLSSLDKNKPGEECIEYGNRFRSMGKAVDLFRPAISKRGKQHNKSLSKSPSSTASTLVPSTSGSSTATATATKNRMPHKRTRSTSHQAPNSIILAKATHSNSPLPSSPLPNSPPSPTPLSMGPALPPPPISSSPPVSSPSLAVGKVPKTNPIRNERLIRALRATFDAVLNPRLNQLRQHTFVSEKLEDIVEIGGLIRRIDLALMTKDSSVLVKKDSSGALSSSSDGSSSAEKKLAAKQDEIAKYFYDVEKKFQLIQDKAPSMSRPELLKQGDIFRSIASNIDSLLFKFKENSSMQTQLTPLSRTKSLRSAAQEATVQLNDLIIELQSATKPPHVWLLYRHAILAELFTQGKVDSEAPSPPEELTKEFVKEMIPNGLANFMVAKTRVNALKILQGSTEDFQNALEICSKLNELYEEYSLSR